ncbi:hypothetical protein ASE66_25305 [Bosea sp. Root483D1]|uniref:hypothetical protein n=1 Tax=Bosea sp. Root483D1 TaxID=1736544 RepID=UPI000709AF7C|nr:hypothetical protein [Bosea sp. Root483D1]KRE23249.1 hypothetical protein ASE66_25305 [Bosea sp. Root483D1]
MQTLFGFELSSGLRWIIAFAVVLLLVALLGFFLRRMSGGRLKFKGQGGGRTRQPRLGVVDVYDLDRQRQLILVRRDNVEHLVMIGGASDVVVETNILRSGGRVAVPLPTEGLAERPLALEPEPRPHAAEEPRPLPPSPVPALAVPVEPVPPPRPAPPPAPPPRAVVQPPTLPPPLRPAPAPQSASIPPAVAASAVGIGATLARDPAPAASASELGDMARQLEEALKRPFSAVRPGSAGPRTEPEAPPAPKPVVTPPPAASEPPTAPKPAAPAPARPALDMEAELEMALGLKPAPARPAASEAPLVAPPVFAPPKPPAAGPVKADEKKPEPAKEQAPEPSKPTKFAPVFDDVLDEVQDTAKADKAEAPAKNEPKPSESKPAEAKPQEAKAADTKAADAKPAEVKPADEPKPAAKPAEDDPFSVDAIEAEFARLLGRDPKTKG